MQIFFLMAVDNLIYKHNWWCEIRGESWARSQGRHCAKPSNRVNKNYSGLHPYNLGNPKVSKRFLFKSKMQNFLCNFFLTSWTVYHQLLHRLKNHLCIIIMVLTKKTHTYLSTYQASWDFFVLCQLYLPTKCTHGQGLGVTDVVFKQGKNIG